MCFRLLMSLTRNWRPVDCEMLAKNVMAVAFALQILQLLQGGAHTEAQL